MPRSRTTLACCLALLLFSARAEAAWITIGWDQNTEPDLAGYLVSYGTAAGRDEVMVNVGKTTTWTFPAANVGIRYFFRVYAYNSSGLRSSPSTEVNATVQSTDNTGPFSLDRTSLNFGAVRAGVRLSTIFSPPQTVVVTPNSGAAASWTVVSGSPWLVVSPTAGTGTGTFTVELRASGLPLAGSYTGSVTVTAGGSSLSLPVALEVKGQGTTRGPIGSFDTPIDGSKDVSGAVPVTGWAVDDVMVSKVQIFRDPVPGEAGEIYVGDATFVAGARPDVEAGFATWPLNYRAGWGFMLLTNMLPDIETRAAAGGNGTFRIHAYALDPEGNATKLGTKTIHVKNRGAKAPFGTIDTPPQGGTVSGSQYVNFGWAIAPDGTIPADGSTITVYVDGVAMGRPSYNHYRDDIGSAFAGYSNSAGPVGFYVLDTTKLSNGMHSIAWVASDTSGNSSGLGSRFFTVLNDETASVTMAVQSATFTGAPAGAGAALGQSAERVADVPLENTSVEVSRTADVLHQPETVVPDWDGELEIQTVETEPIELRLATTFTSGLGGSYEGYLVSHGSMRPLPLGSTLDTTSGVFSWQPGAGYVGTYELVFLRTAEDGQKTRIPVRIVIAPPFSRGGQGR